MSTSHVHDNLDVIALEDDLGGTWTLALDRPVTIAHVDGSQLELAMTGKELMKAAAQAEVSSRALAYGELTFDHYIDGTPDGRCDQVIVSITDDRNVSVTIDAFEMEEFCEAMEVEHLRAKERAAEEAYWYAQYQAQPLSPDEIADQMVELEEIPASMRDIYRDRISHL